MCVISYYSKSPLVEFMAWLQKASGEHKQAQLAARAVGRTYLGPTPLSYLVSAKGREFRNKIVSFFDKESDEDGGFGKILGIVPPRLANAARQLIATMLCVLLCSWDFRFEKLFAGMPCQLLSLWLARDLSKWNSRLRRGDRRLTISAQISTDCARCTAPLRLVFASRASAQT